MYKQHFTFTECHCTHIYLHIIVQQNTLNYNIKFYIRKGYKLFKSRSLHLRLSIVLYFNFSVTDTGSNRLVDNCL